MLGCCSNNILHIKVADDVILHVAAFEEQQRKDGAVFKRGSLIKLGDVSKGPKADPVLLIASTCTVWQGPEASKAAFKLSKHPISLIYNEKMGKFNFAALRDAVPDVPVKKRHFEGMGIHVGWPGLHC